MIIKEEDINPELSDVENTDIEQQEEGEVQVSKSETIENDLEESEDGEVSEDSLDTTGIVGMKNIVDESENRDIKIEPIAQEVARLIISNNNLKMFNKDVKQSIDVALEQIKNN